MHGMVLPDAILENGDFIVAVPILSDLRDLQQFTARMAAPLQPPRAMLKEQDWRRLITTKDAVVAKRHNGTIAGFYLTHHYPLVYEGNELEQHRAALNVLCNRLRLSDNNVAFGSQVRIEPDWQGSDLRGQLLRTLLRNVGLRYRYIFNTVEKENLAEMQALPAEGWQCFHEEDDVCYMMLNVAKALRLLASRLAMQLASRISRPATERPPWMQAGR